MPRVVLLSCPVCDSMRAFDEDLDTLERPTLLDAADEHLAEHRLDESTRALRKHEAVATAEERLVPDPERDALPTDGWLAALPAEG
ncbi:hypothetical protein EFA46_012235 (plasmid) [Halarchaeum sp. CBA1220]|uniref:hypothetical protein n=1 Tax=Halarchaeum sp. CBA1220 TaxID=1853682 RepID=UPI000F3A94A1|nr:hypothetical protein [Halarchaeum sp. CBA1220]QLC35019.1 hypothetical protein EFA46_012235 [Halarchaeum sp. CBA1220]